MSNVGIAFDILHINQHISVGWKPVTGRELILQLQNTMDEQKKIYYEEKHFYKASMHTMKKESEAKINRLQNALQEMEHSHNEKLFQLVKAIENLTHVSNGLQREVSGMKSQIFHGH